LKYGITLSKFVWLMTRLYLLPRFGVKKNLKKYGSWAVVTGSTDGIGKAVAKQLAKRGLNLVLISRSEEKLKTVAEEFAAYNVEVKTIAYDFSDVASYGKISVQLEGLDIGILVNNVGIGYDHPDYFLELTNEFCERLINVDITSIPKMTRMVLAGMVQRKRGLIVHVSSESSLQPIPLLTLYSAAKAFVNFFSNALHHEYAARGLDIHNQVITPSFVSTNLSKMRAKGFMVPTADSFAASAVDAFGLSTNMCGCWAHELKCFAASLIPEFLFYKIALGMMQATRKRWLKKQQAKKE